MTEFEWLTCEEPGKMLEWAANRDGYQSMSRRTGPGGMWPPMSDRKLRLLACACARQVWDQLTDPRSHRAIEVAEKYEEGLCNDIELRDAHWNALITDRHWASELAMKCAGSISVLIADSGLPRWFSVSAKLAASQATLLREIVGNQWRPIPGLECAKVQDGVWHETAEWIGNPTVLAIARAAYCEERSGRGSLNPDTLAILADALEDAGCDCEELLRHLHGQEPCCCLYGYPPPPNKPQCTDGWLLLRGPHVWGCWALDLVLGKI